MTSNGVNEPALHAHRFLLRAGLSMANLFAWVFLFEYFTALSGDLGRALAGTALLYALAQFITFVATPISAAHLRRGTKHSIIWGVVFAAAAFVVLGATLAGYGFASGENGAVWGTAAFAVLFGTYRALYWVPYALAQTGIRPHLHMRAYLEVLIALIPLFAGITIASAGFGHIRLLFGASALIALSVIPAFFLADTREKFSWPYVYAFRQLWRYRNHGLVLRSMLDGLQGAALFLAWPLAIFLIVEGSYVTLGFVFSMTLLFILLFRRAYAWMLGAAGLRDSATLHTVVAVTGWIARLAAGTPVGIVVADVYSYTTQPERGVRADPFSHEHASDRGTFVDEYTALKEIALALGKIMFCVVIFLLAFIFDLPIVFAIALGIAAFASGVSAVIGKRGFSPTY